MRGTRKETKYEEICSIPEGEVVPAKARRAPRRIFLAKGVTDKPAYQTYVDRIVRQFPDAEVVDARGRSWTDADRLAGVGFGARFDEGKLDLVLAVRRPFITNFDGINSDVRCPSFLRAHFQDLCPFSCSYCYLTGATTTRIAPQPKIFVNLDEMSEEVRQFVARNGHVFLSAGELQDSLAQDWYAGQAAKVVEFFADVDARILFLTKSDEVSNILKVDHRGHTILSWSINSDELTRTVERGSAPLPSRLAAARLAQEAGYPIRFRFDPLLAEGAEWTIRRRDQYREMVRSVFDAVHPERITLGSFRAVSGAKAAHDKRVEAGRVERAVCDEALARIGQDGRWRYGDALRREMYRFVLAEIRKYDPGVPVALCKETLPMWEEVGLDPRSCSCNCVEGAVDLTRLA